MSGETPDGTRYPWAKDFDGVWHLRPVDDEWVILNDGPNARTVCGDAIPSVHVATWPMEGTVCQSCERSAGPTHEVRP